MPFKITEPESRFRVTEPEAKSGFRVEEPEDALEPEPIIGLPPLAPPPAFDESTPTRPTAKEFLIDRPREILGGASKELGTMLGTTGRAIPAVMEDALLPDAFRENLGNHPNLDAALDRQKTPAQQFVETQPAAVRWPYKAARAGLEMSPQLAAVAGAQAAGVPAPVAAGAVFGSTEEGFDPKMAAIGAALPFVGRYAGAISRNVAQRLGVSSDVAANLVGAVGNQAAANSMLAADQYYSYIRHLPEEEQARAWEDVIAGNIAFAALGLMEKQGPVTRRGAATEELSRLLKEGDIQARSPEELGVIQPRGKRELGIPPVTAEPFLQPGVPELADVALRDQMSPIITPGRGGALRDLRNAVEGEARRIVEERTATKEDVGGGNLEAGTPAESIRVGPSMDRALKSADQIIAEEKFVNPFESPEKTSGPLKTAAQATKERRAAAGAAEANDKSPADLLVEDYVANPQSGNTISTKSGMAAKTVADLDALAKLKIESAENGKRLLKEGKVDEALVEHQKGQLAREAIEVATDTGSWVEAESRDFGKLGERPLDHTKNPEVAKWLAENAEKVGIKMPEKAAVETQKPRYTEDSNRLQVESKNKEFNAEAWVNGRAADVAVNAARSLIEGAAAKTVDQSILSRWKKVLQIAEKKQTQPNQGKISQQANDLANKLDNLKSGVDPKRGDLGTFNVIPKVWDAAIEVAQKIIRAGGSVADAIDAALKHIRDNNEGKSFLEREARRELDIALNSPAAPKSPTSPATPAPKTGSAAGSKPSPAPASAPAPTPAPPTPPRAPTPGPVTLDDIYKRFEPKPKTPKSIKQRGVEIAEAFRTGLSSKFRPVNKLAEDIAKAYGRTGSKDIAGIMEQLKGSQGKGEADIYRFDQDVSKKVAGSEKDFNAYMMLRRTLDRLNQDAADAAAGLPVRRKVSAYTTPEIQAKLSLLESKLGPDKLAKFQDAADLYQQHMDQALRLQVESGRMSQQQYQDIKNGNQFYAPFKVMKYNEITTRPEGAGSKIDTMAEFTKAMEGIEDPNFRLGDMLGAARQSILLSRILADKNNAMRNISELAAFDTAQTFIKPHKPGQLPPDGFGVVKVLENGKEKQYAVNEDVANALQLYGGKSENILVRMLAKASIPFRWGATGFNIPFQVSNLLADVPRAALISKYGIRNPVDAVRFALDFIHAGYSSIRGDMLGGRFGKNQLMQDFLDSGVAGTTVQEYLTPEALQFKEPSNVSRSRKLASTVLNTIPEFAQAIEQTSKVLGVKRAMRLEGATSGKDLAKRFPEAVTEVRRFSGSPDFGRQGEWIEAARLNLLYMFLNARVQGTIADVGRGLGRDGARRAAESWFRVGTAVGIPTVLLWALNQREENKADFEKRSQQEKDNYWLFPKYNDDGTPRYITTEDGDKIRDFWRLPKRESAKWIANLTEAGMRFAEKKDPAAVKDFANTMLQELVPVNIQGNNAQEKIESVASGLNPMIKAPLELATGRDLYRHRDLMSDRLRKASPEQQYTERTAEAFKVLAEKMPDVAPEFLRSPIILENLTRNLSAGLFTQFLPRKPVKGRTNFENNPLMQRFQSIPYEDNTEFKEQMMELEREGADASLQHHRAATKLLNDNEGKQLLEYAGEAPDLPTFRLLVDLYVAKQNGATQQDRQILSLPAAQRAKYVLHAISDASPEDKNMMLLEFARKRILTEAVLQEMAKELNDTTP